MSSAAGLAGSAYNSAYAASKAFELVLGESLWAEWGSNGVDGLSVIGPAIDTPTFRRSVPDTANLPEPPAAPERVVVDVLEALGTTPSMVPSKKTGEALAFLGTLPRQTQVEALSATHRSMFERND
jgi:short-subunit dehydrogenase